MLSVWYVWTRYVRYCELREEHGDVAYKQMQPNGPLPVTEAMGQHYIATLRVANIDGLTLRTSSCYANGTWRLSRALCCRGGTSDS